MRVFIAGASGALGKVLVPRLIAAGDEVIGMTRSDAGAAALAALGAKPVVVDALDAGAVREAMVRERPEVVVEQLTALPRRYTPEEMRKAGEANHRIRVEGGANVLRAAEEAGARRYVAQSGCFFLAQGDGLAGDDEAFDHAAPAGILAAIAGTESVEARVLAGSMAGVVLRYGFFYGPGTWFWSDGDVGDTVRAGQFPVIGGGTGVYDWVHLEDAADATVAAVHSELAGRFNINDDRPVAVSQWLPAFARWLGATAPPEVAAEAVPDEVVVYYATRMRGASNRKARERLGFRPRPLAWLT